MKACPFCAEQIQDEAIKCRFCGSDVSASPNPIAAIANAAHGPASSELAAPKAPGVYEVAGAGPAALQARPIYGGIPSWKAYFWHYVGAALTGSAVAGLMVTYVHWIAMLVCVAAALIWWGVIELRRRSTHYRITERSLDIEYGVFSKRIETTQLWRVRDLQFKQSLMDRILGIAHIHVYTHDVTDPDEMIEGVPGSREVFEKMREAIDLSKQGRNVVGVVD